VNGGGNVGKVTANQSKNKKKFEGGMEIKLKPNYSATTEGVRSRSTHEESKNREKRENFMSLQTEFRRLVSENEASGFRRRNWDKGPLQKEEGKQLDVLSSRLSGRGSG